MNRVWLGLGLMFASCGGMLDQAAAQSVISDGTLNTVVTGSNSFIITNGRAAGNHLFHSFREFSIPTGGSATFDLGTTPNISTIFSRVTGNSVSNIDGLIKTVNGNTPVSLFLLNPKGILFGANAKLEISGSFVSTTADKIRFADGSEFAASTPAPLLTMSVPVGLQFGSAPGSIINRSTVNSTGLQVPPGQSIVLAGGEIRLEGGRLRSPNGQIELASIATAGTIGMTIEGNDIRLNLSDLPRGDISFSTAANVNVGGTPSGRIAIQAATLNLSGNSQILSQISGAGAANSRSGNVEITASNAININSSGILNRVLATGVGNAGNLNIKTGSLFVTNGGYLVTNTRGRGNAGQLNIQATNTVSFEGADRFGNQSLIFTGVNAGAIGNGGELNITAGTLSVSDGAYLASSTLGKGDAGILNIRADTLLVSQGAFLSTATLGQGNGNTLNIDANTVRFDGFGKTGAATFATSAVNEDAIGNGGVINITANQLSVTNGALLTTVTVMPGSAGDININANTLELLNGGQIISTTYSAGKAGTLRLNVSDRITLSGSDPAYAERSQLEDFDEAFSNGAVSGLFANTDPRATGAGGDLRIQTRQLFVQDGATVSVSSQGTGNAGNLLVSADSIRLNAASLQAESQAGSQGNILLTAKDVLLRQGSKITTNAMGVATGGNITIEAPILVGIENSDISANSIQGRGGNIQITTQEIVGLKYRDRLTPDNDITASSELGISGTVNITTPAIDPNSALMQLSTELVDANQQIAQSCNARSNSQFVVSGRGGMPPNPSEKVNRDRAWNDLRDLSTLPRTVALSASSEPLIEASSWQRNVQTGKIELIAGQSVRRTAIESCTPR